MLETLIKLYTTYMAQDVRSPMPHLAGPPGVGKSSVIYELGNLLGVKVHTLNVARLSPLEIEGVQMPSGTGSNMKLQMLHSTVWTKLKEGDILLMDEFLRGFPEVYNGLLDIFTSREVAGYQLPKVFIVGASNSITTYDEALQDRLLNLFVKDIRTSVPAQNELKERLVQEMGLHPEMVLAFEMNELVDTVIKPTYDVLDKMKGLPNAGGPRRGLSGRNLIGQVKLRQLETPQLERLIRANNARAISEDMLQYLIIYKPDPSTLTGGTKVRLEQLLRNARTNGLSESQLRNVQLNLQLIEMESAKKANLKGEAIDDPDFL